MAELWKELHLRALNFKGDNDLAYLQEFAKRIPRYTPNSCACKEKWRLFFQKNPPKFGPNGEYFAWTVLGHNETNRQLGKPEFTLQQAKDYYTKLDREMKNKK